MISYGVACVVGQTETHDDSIPRGNNQKLHYEILHKITGTLMLVDISGH